jgi:hypothetical protein
MFFRNEYTLSSIFCYYLSENTLLLHFRLLLFRKIVAVVSESHMKLINSLCAQATELLDVKAGDAYSTVTAVFQMINWRLQQVSVGLVDVPGKEIQDFPQFQVWQGRRQFNCQCNADIPTIPAGFFFTLTRNIYLYSHLCLPAR